MILKALTLENFKGIREPVRIEFAPLTLLFGPNNAGKSTIVQALMYAREVLERNNCDAGRTELGGDIVDLGGFENIVHAHDLSRPIRMRFELDLGGVPAPELQGDLMPVLCATDRKPASEDTPGSRCYGSERSTSGAFGIASVQVGSGTGSWEAVAEQKGGSDQLLEPTSRSSIEVVSADEPEGVLLGLWLRARAAFIDEKGPVAQNLAVRFFPRIAGIDLPAEAAKLARERGLGRGRRRGPGGSLPIVRAYRFCMTKWSQVR